MTRHLPRFIFALFMLLCAGMNYAAAPFYRVTNWEVLPGAVKWDYLTYDSGSKRLFITRGDRVDVYDTARGHIVASIPDTDGVHGVALAPDLDKGFTSNGRINTVTVFDLSSLKVLSTLPTGQKPDSIVYDPLTRRIFVANGDSGSLTVINAVNNEVVGNITVGGKLETEAVDGMGRLYVNIEDKNSLAVIDTVSMTVMANRDLSAVCREPAGLAIDPASERLFVGCRNERMAVVAGNTGQILASIPIGKGCDATGYDSELHLAFSSNGEGTLSIVSADTYSLTQTLDTYPTARTMALDATNHRIYTVAANREEPIEQGKRPRLIPGTFTLITVER